VTLAEAVALAGGAHPQAGDARAIFVFRLEAGADGGEVPVVYHLDMMQGGSFFLAQRFAMQDKDVLYVGNAAANQPGKLVQLISQLFSPVVAVQGTLWRPGWCGRGWEEGLLAGKGRGPFAIPLLSGEVWLGGWVLGRFAGVLMCERTVGMRQRCGHCAPSDRVSYCSLMPRHVGRYGDNLFQASTCSKNQMTNGVLAFLMFSTSAYCVWSVIDGFRTGVMDPLTRGWRLQVERAVHPRWFWCAVCWNGFWAGISFMLGIHLESAM
jgi:hypothetical protein